MTELSSRDRQWLQQMHDVFIEGVLARGVVIVQTFRSMLPVLCLENLSDLRIFSSSILRSVRQVHCVASKLENANCKSSTDLLFCECKSLLTESIFNKENK